MSYKNYKKLVRIGSGTYCKVYRAIDKKTNGVVAIKKFKKDDDPLTSVIIRELVVSTQLQHNNIINVFNIFRKKNKIYQVMDYCDYDLFTYIYKISDESLAERAVPSGLSSTCIQNIMWQILNGVQYMHSQSFIHRDLKPQNILMDRSGNVKLCDFNLSRRIESPDPSTHTVITLYYRPPELLLDAKNYSFEIDVWSIGCIFYELFMKKVLFEGDSEIDQLYKIFQICGTPDDNDGIWDNITYHPQFPHWVRCFDETMKEIIEKSESAFQLIKQLLIYNPVERITCKEALNHSYFPKGSEVPEGDTPAGSFSEGDNNNNNNNNEALKESIVDNYMSTIQSYITKKHREILVDWLIGVASEFRLRPETLYKTICILDRFLSLVEIDTQKLQLVGISCLQLASKLEEIYGIENSECAWICDKACNVREIINMQFVIIESLNYKLYYPSAINFLRTYSKILELDTKTHTYARYILEATLQKYKFTQYKSSQLAAAACLLAIADDSVWEWSESKIGYSKHDLKTCVKQLKKNIKSIKKSKYNAVYKKYESIRNKIVC